MSIRRSHIDRFEMGGGAAPFPLEMHDEMLMKAREQ